MNIFDWLVDGKFSVFKIFFLWLVIFYVVWVFYVKAGIVEYERENNCGAQRSCIETIKFGV